MRIAASPRGTGSFSHLLVAVTQLVNRAKSGVREKRSNHNRLSTARTTTLSGFKSLVRPSVSQYRLMLFLSQGYENARTQLHVDHRRGADTANRTVTRLTITVVTSYPHE